MKTTFSSRDRVRLIDPGPSECHRTGTVMKHVHDKPGYVRVLWDGNGGRTVHVDRLKLIEEDDTREA